MQAYNIHAYMIHVYCMQHLDALKLNKDTKFHLMKMYENA